LIPRRLYYFARGELFLKYKQISKIVLLLNRFHFVILQQEAMVIREIW
jgi:hypothetical protein